MLCSGVVLQATRRFYDLTTAVQPPNGGLCLRISRSSHFTWSPRLVAQPQTPQLRGRSYSLSYVVPYGEGGYASHLPTSFLRIGLRLLQQVVVLHPLRVFGH